MSHSPQTYDLVIIGAAAAGCAAAVYAARRHLNFVVVTKDIGGEVALSGEVENWPGIEHITGFELAQNFHKHTQAYNTPIEQGLSVETIEQDGKYHLVKTKNYGGKEKIFKTKSVIIGSGIHPRELGVTGEKELKGKGLTYCTVCDGPLFKGKITTTIGAGSAALESALMMAEIASKVYLVTKYPKENHDGFPKGETILLRKLQEKNNVEIIYNANTTEVLGENNVTGCKYTDNDSGEEHTLDTDGVMVHIGMTPNSQFAGCVRKNTSGEIEINILCQTDRPGIFAAGDVTNVPYNQIAIAAGHGATAALSAIDYINRWSE